MQYGKVVGVSGAVVLPLTGSNSTLLIIASSMIALGLAVLVASVLIARKKNLNEVDLTEVK